MKFKILIVLLLISVAFNLGILSKMLLDSPKSPAPKANTCNSWSDCSSQLDLGLSCKQVEQLEVHRKAFREAAAPLKAQLVIERKKLFEVVLKKAILDEADATKQVAVITELQARLQDLFIRHFFRVKGIFNNEQQGKLYYYVQLGLCSGKSGSCSQTHLKHRKHPAKGIASKEDKHGKDRPVKVEKQEKQGK